MSQIAVFDTNIIIDALNGLEAADMEYQRYERVLISRVTWMEALVGATDESDGQIRNFLSTRFEVISLNLAVAERVLQLRRSYRIRLPDAIIWATAQAYHAVLVSRNTKDFDPAWEGIRVPYTL